MANSYYARRRASKFSVWLGAVLGLLVIVVFAFALNGARGPEVTPQNAKEHIEAKLSGIEIEVLNISDEKICSFGNLFCRQIVEFQAVFPTGEVHNGLASCNSKMCNLIPDFRHKS